MSVIKEKIAQQKLIKVLNSFRDAFKVQDGINCNHSKILEDILLRLEKIEIVLNLNNNEDDTNSYPMKEI